MTVRKGKYILKVEIKKALSGYGFLFSISVGIIIVLVQSVAVNRYLHIAFFDITPDEKLYAYTADVSFLQAWIGQDVVTAFGFLYYLILFPLLACLPYAASHLREKELGYDKICIVQLGKGRYLRNKYMTAFLTGGIAVTFPSLLSVIIAMTYLPIIPETLSMAQTGVSATTLWGVIFYEKPLLYVFLWLALDFVVGGCLAVCGLALTFFVESKFQVLVLPMILNMLLVELLNYAPGILGNLCKLVPYIYVAPAGIAEVSGKMVAVSILLMLLGSAGLYLLTGKRKDVL